MNNPTVLPSEREFSPQSVCVPLTGVMIARAFNPAVPGTKAEVLALAVQMGAPNGVGANYGMLKPAMKARYGLTGMVIDHMGGPVTYQAVMGAAGAGPCVIGVAGDQAVLTPVWQKGNHVGHSIAVLYQNGTTGVQLDPLAPAGYTGDPFTPAELAKYGTAAIIFTTPKEESGMPGFKSVGPKIGVAVMPAAGHSLISPSDTTKFFPQPAGGTFDVYASLDLRTPNGVPVDIGGSSPPQNKRDQVYLVDAPGFGAGAYMLRADGAFTPVPAGHSDAEVAAARSAGIKAAADAAAQVK